MARISYDDCTCEEGWADYGHGDRSDYRPCPDCDAGLAAEHARDDAEFDREERQAEAREFWATRWDDSDWRNP